MDMERDSLGNGISIHLFDMIQDLTHEFDSGLPHGQSTLMIAANVDFDEWPLTTGDLLKRTAATCHDA
jgi:hypothetical protein